MPCGLSFPGLKIESRKENIILTSTYNLTTPNGHSCQEHVSLNYHQAILKQPGLAQTFECNKQCPITDKLQGRKLLFNSTGILQQDHRPRIHAGDLLSALSKEEAEAAAPT